MPSRFAPCRCSFVCSLSLVLFSLAPLAGRMLADAPIADVEGRPQVSWQQVDKVVGKTAFVFGKVTGVDHAGQITFLNFDEARPAKFKAVIFDDNIGNFTPPPQTLYKDKIVRIRGRIAKFKDSLEIVVAKPSQIEVLQTMPTSFIPEPPKSRAPQAGELVIGAYNVLNLFDDVDDPYKEDEGTPAKPREELTALAKSITTLNADVLAMEEVENREYLKRFIDVFLPDMGYRNVVLVEGNDGRGIDVALVSRIPVGVVRSHQHLWFTRADGTPEHFQRDALCVQLLPRDGKPFYAWCVHLKSKSEGQEETEPIRLAEATKLRELLDKELAADPQERFVVMGDFNDELPSKSLQKIIGSGPNALWVANSDLKDPDVVTYNKGDFRSVIDFMLCSPAMAKTYVKGSFHVTDGSTETTGSDHNPIAAVFKTN